MVKKYLFLLLIIMIVLCSAAFARAKAPNVEMVNIQVKVRSGDTVWELAEQFRNKDEDVREIVTRICQVNGLVGAVIKPGNSIVIPVQKQLKEKFLAKISE